MSFLFAPAAGAATLPPSADGESPAEVQRKTPRPLGANTPAAVRVPRWVGAERKPPVRGEHADAVRVPRWVGAEKECRPDRANTLTQFVCPGQPVLKKLPPRSGEHACGSSSAPLDFTLISYYTERAKYVVTTTKQEEI